MSYVGLPNGGLSPGFYQNMPAFIPGNGPVPVPGWGKNPYRAGPARVGVGAFMVPTNAAVLPRYTPIGVAEGDQYLQTTYGHVAGAGAAGIMLGLGLGWLWFGR